MNKADLPPFEQSPEEIIVEAEMQAAAGMHTLLLEGDSDHMLLDGHINSKAVAMIPTHGKKNALRINDLLQSNPQILRKVGDLRILVDRDDDKEQPSSTTSLLIMTDGRDLDAEVLAAPGILTAIVSKIQRTPASECTVKVSCIVRAARAVSVLRRISFRLHLEVKIDRVVHYSGDSLHTRPLAALDELVPGLNGDQRANIRAHVMAGLRRGEWSEELSDLAPVISECCGHDLHKAIARYTDRALGHGQIQTMAMLAIAKDISNLPTVKKLKCWAAAAPFSLLATER